MYSDLSTSLRGAMACKTGMVTRRRSSLVNLLSSQELTRIITAAEAQVTPQKTLGELFLLKQALYYAIDLMIREKHSLQTTSPLQDANEEIKTLLTTFTKIQRLSNQLTKILWDKNLFPDIIMPTIDREAIHAPKNALRYATYEPTQLLVLWKRLLCSFSEIEPQSGLLASFELHERLLELLCIAPGASLLHQINALLNTRLEEVKIGTYKNTFGRPQTEQAHFLSPQNHTLISSEYVMWMNTYGDQYYASTIVAVQLSNDALTYGWVPPVLELGHELVHLLHMLQDDDQRFSPLSTPEEKKWTDAEEKATIAGPGMCENALRHALDLPNRIGHCGARWRAGARLSQASMGSNDWSHLNGSNSANQSTSSPGLPPISENAQHPDRQRCTQLGQMTRRFHPRKNTYV